MTGSPLVGKILDGRYKILQILGTGGMGTVYKANDMSLPRLVALKLLHANRIADQENTDRFIREGKIISALSHKHIIAFYHFGVCDDGTQYIAMEYVEGRSMRSLLFAETQLDWQRAVKIAIQICDAMQHAHEKGIIHRDLKPENIMLLKEPETDYVKILDFGLAGLLKAAEIRSHTLTSTGQLLGSINYISPEQCKGQKADNRSDIYALGCIMYEALTGSVPFSAENPIGVTYKHANEQAPKFSSFPKTKEIPEELELIVASAMQKDPSKRYQSMQELGDDLRLLLSGNFDALSHKSKDTSRQTGKNWKYRMALLTVAVLITIIGMFFLSKFQKSKLPEDKPTLRTAREVIKLVSVDKKHIPTDHSPPRVPVELIDQALMLPNISNSEKAQLYFLRSQRSKGPQALVYWNYALPLFANSPVNSFPHAEMSQTLICIADSFKTSGLSRVSLRYYEEAERFAEKYRKSEKNDDESASFFTGIDTVRDLRLNKLNALITLDRSEEARKYMVELLKTEPGVTPFLLKNLLELRMIKEARVLSEKLRDVYILTDLSTTFRSYGLDENAGKALSNARANAEPEQLHELYKEESLFYIETGNPTEALKIVNNHVRIDLPGSIVARRSDGLIPVTLLNMLGQEKEAIEILDKYCDKHLEQDEHRELVELRLFIKNIFPRPLSERIGEMSHYNHSGYMRSCLTANLYYALKRDPQKIDIIDRCKILRAWMQCLEYYDLPLKALAAADEFTTEASKLESTHKRIGLTFKQLATIDKIRILKNLQRDNEAEELLDKLNLSITNKNVEGINEVFGFNLKYHKRNEAEEILSKCKLPHEIAGMASICIDSSNYDLARRCFEHASTITQNPEEQIHIAIQKARLALEQSDNTTAISILSKLDERQLLELRKQYKLDNTIITLMCAAGMLDEAKKLVFTNRTP